MSTSHEDLRVFVLAEVTCEKSPGCLLYHGYCGYLRWSSNSGERVGVVTLHFLTGWIKIDSVCSFNLIETITWQLNACCNNVKTDEVWRVLTMVRYNLGPGLRLARPGGPTARVSVLPFFTWRRKKIQLPKRSNFIKILTMDKVKKTVLQNVKIPVDRSTGIVV
jgi:hypothetical protein